MRSDSCRTLCSLALRSRHSRLLGEPWMNKCLWGGQLLLLEARSVETFDERKDREHSRAGWAWEELGGRLSAQPEQGCADFVSLVLSLCGLAPGTGRRQLSGNGVNTPVLMSCSPFSLQLRLSSSLCFWPASTAAATPGSTCSSRATCSTSWQSASSAAPPAT